jgi:ABC-type multidrug transport system permease subunit
MQLFFYIKIMRSIINQNLFLFKKVFFDKVINMALWVVISLFVTSYILPKMGLVSNYGLIQFAGVLATIGLFESYSYIFPFLADLEGREIIYYELGFPIPPLCLFLSKVISNAIAFILLAFCMIPISKCLLWDIIFLQNFNWFYLIIMLVSSNIFFATMILVIISFVKNMSKIGNVWSRFIFPIWFLGGFQFSWKYLYETNKILAYIDLCNPIIYINEGFKIAILQQEGLCSFWVCIFIICLFSLSCFYIGYRRLKKRLDFI